MLKDLYTKNSTGLEKSEVVTDYLKEQKVVRQPKVPIVSRRFSLTFILQFDGILNDKNGSKSIKRTYLGKMYKRSKLKVN